MQGLKARLKLPLLRHPVKGGMALEGPHPGRKQAEGDSATSVTVVDAVDGRRQFLHGSVVRRRGLDGISGGPFLILGSHRAIQSQPRPPSSYPEAAAQSDELG